MEVISGGYLFTVFIYTVQALIKAILHSTI